MVVEVIVVIGGELEGCTVNVVVDRPEVDAAATDEDVEGATDSAELDSAVDDLELDIATELDINAELDTGPEVDDDPAGPELVDGGGVEDRPADEGQVLTQQYRHSVFRTNFEETDLQVILPFGSNECI